MEKISQQEQAVPCIVLWCPKHFLPNLGADQTDRLLTGEGDKSLKDDFKEQLVTWNHSSKNPVWSTQASPNLTKERGACLSFFPFCMP